MKLLIDILIIFNKILLVLKFIIMSNDITKMTPGQIAKEATAMLNELQIPNHKFFAQGKTIVDRINEQRFTSHYEILRFDALNNYVHNRQNNEKTRVTNLTNIVDVIQNSLQHELQ